MRFHESHWVLNHLKCKSPKKESDLLHIYEKVADFLINDYAICSSPYSGCEILVMKLHGLACNKQHQSRVGVEQPSSASLPHPHSLGSLFI